MTTAAELVARAKAGISEITPWDVSGRLDRVLIVDVREPEEYSAGHLPGAINIPRGLLEFRVDSHPLLCERGREVVLQCQSGGRSALATLTMQELGFKNVVNMAGGYRAWITAGLPVETD